MEFQSELEILGLPTSAQPSLKDLRKAFKRKTISLLPEKHPGIANAHTRFEELNNSFVKVQLLDVMYNSSLT